MYCKLFNIFYTQYFALFEFVLLQFTSVIDLEEVSNVTPVLFPVRSSYQGKANLLRERDSSDLGKMSSL